MTSRGEEGRDRLSITGATIGGASVALSVTAVVLWAAGSGIAGTDDRYYFVVDIVTGLVYGAAGGLIVHRLPKHRVGWLLLIVAIGHAVAAFSAGYWELSVRWPDLPALRTIGWLTSWTWRPSLVVLATLVLLTVPDGKLPSPRWRPVAWAAVVVAVADTGLALINPRPWPDAAPRSPLGIRSALLNDVIGPRSDWPFHALRVVALLSFAALLVRRSRASPEERRALTWVAIGAAAVTASVVANDLSLIGDNVPAPEAFFPLLQLAALPFLPLVGLVAVLRHRLFGLEIVIRRTIVWLVLTAGVVVVYATVATVVGAFASGQGVSALAAAVIVAIGFQPARLRLQSAVDTLVYGQRRDPYSLVSDLGERIQATVHLDEMLPAICALLTDGMRLSHAAVDALDAGEWTQMASHGTVGDQQLEVPLLDRGEVIGRIVVSTEEGDVITPRDAQLLDDVGRQAALALMAVRVNQELHRSRARLVNTREDERRRLRRELHDELGPTMAGVALGVKAAMNVIDDDNSTRTGEARLLLERLVVELERSVGVVRRMSYDLGPPALDERGLVAALEDYGARHSTDGLMVDVDARDVPTDLSAAVSVAAYRIAVEALGNAARHGRSQHCSVRLRVDDQMLVVRVDDDGSGLQPGFRAGVGLTSMRERASEIGGTCGVEPRGGGGTRVIARLPVSGVTEVSRD